MACARTWFTWVVLLVVLAAGPAWAGDYLDPAMMKAALRTATPEEGGFIDRVVGLAQQGQIPVELVRTTFLWARQKPRYKFQYFKRALEARAKEMNLSLIPTSASTTNKVKTWYQKWSDSTARTLRFMTAKLTGQSSKAATPSPSSSSQALTSTQTGFPTATP